MLEVKEKWRITKLTHIKTFSSNLPCLPTSGPLGPDQVIPRRERGREIIPFYALEILVEGSRGGKDAGSLGGGHGDGDGGGGNGDGVPQ